VKPKERPATYEINFQRNTIYFRTKQKAKVCSTKEIKVRQCLFDLDEDGQMIGVELLIET
jgi:uncharacterized protein YuzE